MVPQLRNVEVLFLPPNTTSRMQSLEVEIIATVKEKYRRRLLFRVFNNIDARVKTISNVDILTAMRSVMEEWIFLYTEDISDCWNNNCFKSASLGSSSDMVSEGHNNLRDQLARDVQEHFVAFSRVGIESFLNLVEEDAVNEVMSLETRLHSLPNPMENVSRSRYVRIMAIKTS